MLKKTLLVIQPTEHDYTRTQETYAKGYTQASLLRMTKKLEVTQMPKTDKMMSFTQSEIRVQSKWTNYGYIQQVHKYNVAPKKSDPNEYDSISILLKHQVKLMLTFRGMC